MPIKILQTVKSYAAFKLRLNFFNFHITLEKVKLHYLENALKPLNAG